MSTVDNRVVKLQFDNAQFEQQVSRSMTTLDKLEEKLQFKKAASGIVNLQANINSVAFDKLVKGIETIEQRLSATGIAAAKIVSEITQSLINGAKKIEQATIGQIKTGGWNRAMNIENAKFAIEGLQGDWDQLYKAMDYAVTGTAYGIDQAAKAASSLMASSVDYTKTIEKNGNTNVTMMHKTLRAISGVAAQTNSDFDSIAHIFTTAAGNGRLMGEQLQQLANRGLNAASVLAKAYNVTEADIRKLASESKISFEMFAKAMDDAFGAHATAANKTFTGSLSNMKAALSRFGAVFATPVIQDTNIFFIALTDKLKEMKNAISDVTENGKVLEKHLEGHFADMWKNLIALSDTMIHMIDLSWFKRVAQGLEGTTERLANFLGIMNEYATRFTSATSSAKETLYNLATITKEEKDLAEKVIKGVFGNGAKRKAALEEEIKKAELDTSPDKIQEYVNLVSKYGYSFDKAGIKVQEFVEETNDANEAIEHIGYVFDYTRSTIKNFNGIMMDLGSMSRRATRAFTNAFGGILGIMLDVTGAFSSFTKSTRTITEGFELAEDAFNGLEIVFRGVYEIVNVISNTLITTYKRIANNIKALTNYANANKLFTRIAKGLYNSLDAISFILDTVGYAIDHIVMTFSSFGEDVIGYFVKIVESVGAAMQVFAQSFMGFEDIIAESSGVTEALAMTLSVIYSIVDDMAAAFFNAAIWITEFVKGVIHSWKESGVFYSTITNLTIVISNLYRIVRNIAITLSRVIKAIATAFFRVFNPAKATGLLANFTGSLADLSDNFVLSEEGAEALADILTVVFTALDNVATTISTVITDIVSFVASLKKTDDALEDTGEESDRTASKFQGALDILNKIHDFVTGAIEGFKELGTELKNNEGIQHLIESLGKLKDSFKDSVGDGLNGFKDAVNEIADDTVAGITIADIAEGIGKVADKLADFIDKAPDIISKVENFFDTVWKAITGFFDKFWNDKDVVGLKENIGNIFNFGGQLAEDAKESVGDIFSKIKKAFSEINWKDVLDTGFVAGAVFFLYKITKFSDSVAHAFDSFGGILDSIVGIFKNIAGIFKSFGAALVNFSKAALLGTAVLGIVAIVGAIYVLSTIDASDLDKALGAIIIVAFIVIRLMKIVNKIADAQAKSADANLQAQKIKKSLSETIASVIQVVGAIYALGKVVQIMVDTTMRLAEFADDHSIGSIVVAFGAVVIALIVILVFVGIAAGLASKLAKRLTDAHTQMTKAVAQAKMLQAILVGAGALLAGIGVLLWGFSQAVTVLASGGDIVEEAMGLTIALMIVMIGGIALVLNAAKGLEAKSMLIIGVIIFEMVVFMGLIFAGIYALSLVFIGLDSFQRENFVLMIEKATQVVLTIMAGAAMLIFSVGLALAMAHNTKGLGTIFFGMIVFIGVLFAGVILMTKELATLKGVKPELLVIAMGAIAVMLLLITNLMNYVVTMVDKAGGDADKIKAATNMVLALAGVIAMISFGIAAILASIGEYQLKPEEIALSLIGLIGILAMVSLIIQRIAKYAGNSSVDAEAIAKISEGFLMIGAMILIISLAVALIATAMNGVSTGGIIATIVATTVIILSVAWLVGEFLGRIGGMGWNVDDSKIEVIKSMGIVLLEIGAAILLIGISVAIMGAVFNKLTPKAMIGVGLVLVAIGALIFFVMAFIKKASKLKISDNLVTVIKNLGLVMMEIAAVGIILAVAAMLMKNVDPGDLVKLMVSIGVLMLLVGLLAAAAGKWEAVGKGLNMIADAFLAVGMAFLALGAGLLLGAVGLNMAAPAIIAFAKAFGYFAEVIKEHQGVAIAVGLAIVLIVGIIAITLMKTLPIIDKIVTAITEAFKVIWDVVKKIGGGIGKGVKKFFTNDKLSNTIKAGISTLLVAAASSLAESGPKVLQKIGDLLWLFIDWLIEITPKLCEKIIQIILDIIWGLLDAITAHINEITAAIRAVLQTLAVIIIKALVDIIIEPILEFTSKIPGIGQYIDVTRKDLIRGVDNLVAANSKSTKELRQAAKEKDASMKAYVEAGTDEDLNYSKWAAKQMKSQENANKELQIAIDHSEETFEKYAELYKTDLNKKFLYAKKASGVPLAQQQAMINQAKGFTDAAGDFYEIYEDSIDKVKANPDVLKNYTYYYSQAAEKIAATPGIVDTLKDKFNIGSMDTKIDLPGSMFDSESINVDIDDISTVMGTRLGVGTVDAAGDGALDALQNFDTNQMADLMENNGLDIMDNGFAVGVDEGCDQSAAAADNNVDAAIGAISDRQDDLKEAGTRSGRNVGKGFGSPQAVGTAISAGEDIVDGMSFWLKRFAANDPSDPKTASYIARTIFRNFQNELTGANGFDIASPSKAMKRIGNYVVEGLSIGLSNGEEGAVQSANDISNAIISSFMNPLDYVSRIASGEYQYDPSIRPVLDTTAIANGAYGINSMFNDQRISLNTLGGSIDTDIGRLDDTNVQIIAELKALRNDMTEMGDKIAGMQVVMDSGRLVGAIAPDMDRALGSRVSSNYRGKG